MTPRIRLESTPTGQVIIGLAVFLVLAGFNTGNNTLYLIATGMLSAMMAQIFFSYINIQGLETSWEPAGDLFAGQASGLTLRLTETLGRERRHLSFGQDFVAMLSGNDHVSVKVRVCFEQRGRWAGPECTIFSLFPFGLTRIHLLVPGTELLVYPRPVAAMVSGGEFGFRTPRDTQSNPEGDYWMHRLYAPGEDSRLIHWQVSARQHQEYVVSHALPRSEPIRCRVDFLGLPPEVFEEFLSRLTGFFLRCSSAESATWSWLPRQDGGDWLSLKDPENLRKWLQFLALAIPQEVASLPPPPGDVQTISWETLVPLADTGRSCL
jgi:uncharacterized protein (DUF58 family)